MLPDKIALLDGAIDGSIAVRLIKQSVCEYRYLDPAPDWLTRPESKTAPRGMPLPGPA